MPETTKYTKLDWDSVNTALHSKGEKFRLKLFLTGGDTLAILQVRDDEDTENMMFRSWTELKKMGVAPDPDQYKLVYTEPLDERDMGRMKFLEHLFTRFNIDHPKSFTGHSMSVSDIVLIREQGTVTAYFVDNAGFVELPPEFIKGSCYVGEESEYNVQYIDGHTDRYVQKVISAGSRQEAIDKIWELSEWEYDNFDHQIKGVEKLKKGA